MPKHQFKVSASAQTEELDDSGFYTGDTPPNGVYAGYLKKLWLKETNDGSNEAFSALFVIDEPKSSPKAKYNGAGIFDWMNLTDASAKFVNRFLSALSFGKNMKEINAKGGFITDDEDPPNITKLGTKRITGEQRCRFASRIDDRGNAKIARVMAPGDDADEDSSETESDEVEGLDVGGDSDESGVYTEEELDELDLGDLKEIAEQLEIELTPKARKSTVIAAILEAQEAAEGGPEEDGDAETEAVTEEEMDEMSIADLKELADSLGMEYPPKITKSKIIPLLVEFQGAPESTDEESPEAVTEEELGEMDKDELVELLKEMGGVIPKPPIKARLVKAILAKQAEAPF